jgi:hypothetical protein
MRQPAQPAGDLVAADPVGVHQCLALAERGVESRITQRGAAFDAGERDIALDGRELE